MTPLCELKHFVSPTKKLVIMSYGCNISQKEMHAFKKWAKQNGWGLQKTYRHESKRRAFTLTKGNISMLCIERITKPFSEENPGGHFRNDDSVILECNISCFINGNNLGQYDIGWPDFMTGEAELLIHCRVPKLIQY